MAEAPSVKVLLVESQIRKRIKRITSETTKKMVAASQSWTCAHCFAMLSSSYEVDHTIPLWRNGADTVDNLRALCSNCHSIKSQKESQERAEERRARRVDARSRYENDVQREEESKRSFTKLPSGTIRCTDCSCRYYPVFRHDCRRVAAKVDTRLGRKPQVPQLGRMFEEFYFTGI